MNQLGGLKASFSTHVEQLRARPRDEKNPKKKERYNPTTATTVFQPRLHEKPRIALFKQYLQKKKRNSSSFASRPSEPTQHPSSRASVVKKSNRSKKESPPAPPKKLLGLEQVWTGSKNSTEAHSSGVGRASRMFLETLARLKKNSPRVVFLETSTDDGGGGGGGSVGSKNSVETDGAAAAAAVVKPLGVGQRMFLETLARLKQIRKKQKSTEMSAATKPTVPLWGPRQRERAPPTSDEQQWDAFLDKVREAATVNEATEQRARIFEDWKNYPRKPTEEEEQRRDWEAFMERFRGLVDMDYWNDPRTSDERERDAKREREQREKEKEQSDWEAFMQRFRGLVDMDYWNDPRTSDERERDAERVEAAREAEEWEKTKRAHAFALAEQQQRAAWEQQRVAWEGLTEAFVQHFGDSKPAKVEEKRNSKEGLDDEVEQNIKMLEQLRATDDAIERAKLRKTHLENVRRGESVTPRSLTEEQREREWEVYLQRLRDGNVGLAEYREQRRAAREKEEREREERERDAKWKKIGWVAIEGLPRRDAIERAKLRQRHLENMKRQLSEQQQQQVEEVD